MIVINYVKPNIVIAADYLISGKVTIYHKDEFIYSQDINNEHSVNIHFNTKLYSSIRLELTTTEETITKRFNF